MLLASPRICERTATLLEPDERRNRLSGIDVLNQRNEVCKILDYLSKEFGVYLKMNAGDLIDPLRYSRGIAGQARRSQRHSSGSRT